MAIWGVKLHEYERYLFKMGECAFEWMAKDIPALGDQSPAAYLETEEGAQALRAAIMRMPR
ncbi:antitoxin Xre/MbcA/ParS toxin-binding domain-containing protein [Paenibacillus sp. ClWae2A]|uniref:antitoxin Xre/MbcA/ParS toxin-binding domain-containing protein n=1 Tax=Paenibacillus sp. ClWae2A TaxID=3057177 RepID=UPI0037C8F5A5